MEISPKENTTQSCGRGQSQDLSGGRGASSSGSENDAARHELTSHKRVAQPDHLLDAPQRKHGTQNPSPLGDAIEFGPPVQVMSPEKSQSPCETDAIDNPAPSTSNTIGVDDESFEEIVADWLDNVFRDNNSDVDEDVDDLEVISLPTFTIRKATDYPADDNDVSLEQLLILQVEEQADDQYVRELAASTTSCDFTWTCDRQTFTGTRESFTASHGPTFLVTDKMTPVDVFNKMFDDEFFDILVTETNRYADQTIKKLKQDPRTKQHEHYLTWTPTDRSEMVAYLAVIILQGLWPKESEKSYFTFDGFGTTHYFSRIMSYDRFYQLNTFLHFTDNERRNDVTKLYKIRPILDYFNERFASLYNPGQEITIDERLLKCHGPWNFAQKVSSRGTQVGVKTYELCDTSTGYLWSFRVFYSKDGINRTRQFQPDQDIQDRQHCEDDDDRHLEDRPEDERLGHSIDSTEMRPSNATKIAYELVEPLLHRGHTLIMDSFYNCPLLARCLKQTKTDVFGPLRLTREFVPDALKTAYTDIRKGEVMASYCSDLAVMVMWGNGKLISMISTYHPLQVEPSDEYNKPAIVLDYNRCMGRVDRKYQILGSQPLENTDNKVWYKSLFRRLFNAALFNLFVIFTSNPIHKYSHRDFRTILAETLLQQYRQIDLRTELGLTQPGQPTTTNSVTVSHSARPYVEGNHFPMATGSKMTLCWMCARNNIFTRTGFKCEECNINLCLDECFKEYHYLTDN